MKTNKIIIKGVIAAVLFFAVSPVVSAQSDAGAILKSMAAAIKGLGNYTVSYRITVEGNATVGEYTVSGNRYYISAGEIEVYSEGSLRYEVNHMDEEVVIDRLDPNDRGILSNPTQVFDFAEDAFTAAYKGVMNEGGKQYDIVELKPRDGDTSIRNIELTVNKTTKLPHSISYLADGISGYIVIDVLRIASAPNVPDSLFKPDMNHLGGYEVIEPW